jgi:hypothetical protein
MTRKQLATAYRRAWKRIENPDHWCSNAFAVDRQNRSVTPESRNAVRWCAVGTLMAPAPAPTPKVTVETKPIRAASSPYGRVVTLSSNWHDEFYGDMRSVWWINDNLGHEEVRNMFALAIHLVEEGHFDYLCEETK